MIKQTNSGMRNQQRQNQSQNNNNNNNRQRGGNNPQGGWDRNWNQGYDNPMNAHQNPTNGPFFLAGR